MRRDKERWNRNWVLKIIQGTTAEEREDPGKQETNDRGEKKTNNQKQLKTWRGMLGDMKYGPGNRLY